METKRYSVQNKSSISSLSTRVKVVDGAAEPLRVLKVLVEGLASDENVGLWLRHLTSIPMVPRLAPFDLAYLDENDRVVEGVELLPDAELPPLKSPSVSALVLPFHTISKTKTNAGDQLMISAAEEDEPEAEAGPKPVVQAAPERVPAGRVGFAGQKGRAASAQTQAKAAVAATQAAKKPPMAERGNGHNGIAAAMETAVEERSDVAMLAQFLQSHEVRTHKAAESAPVRSHSEKVTEFPAVDGASSAATKHAAAAVVTMSLPLAAKDEPKNTDAPAKKLGPWGRMVRWLYPALYAEDQRKAPRGHLPELVAYDPADAEPQAYPVANISSTGLYLLTEKRWPADKPMVLTLQRKGPLAEQQERRFELQADLKRVGVDGVGLSFILPPGMEWNLWGAGDGDATKDADALVTEFRVQKALAFVRTVCPAAEERARELFRKEFSNVRVASALEILFKAEELLERDSHSSPLQASPEVVTRILECGSWGDAGWIRELWAGLLATSCTEEGQDESNLVFVELLSKLAPIHARILAAACAKATKEVPESVPAESFPLYCSADEMTQITGSTDLTKIHRSIAHLSDLGLLERSARSSFVAQSERAKTTPTSFGLQMYARCLGYRGAA